jgi:flagellar biosynthesis component FlhA
MIRGKETWPFTILCSSLISSVLGIAVYHFYSKCSIKDADEKRRHIWLSKEKKSQEKSKKKEAKRQFRREKKGQRHIEKKQELQVKRKELFARMTQDQKNEQMERIKLARVESYVSF